jgi:hypothetical protein
MPKLDPRRTLTKAKILKALANVPDDYPIYINVEFEDGENWDTWNAFMIDMSYMCPVNPGCQHTEPEMFWEIVLGVKFGEELGIMEVLENEDDEDHPRAVK